MVRNTIGIIAVVGVLLGAVLFSYRGNAAQAQEPPIWQPSHGQEAQQERPDMPMPPEGPEGEEPPMHHGGRHGHGGIVAAGLVKATAEVSEITMTEVLDGLRNGQTLAQVAEANGKSADEVLQAFATLARERLDEAVANGHMTDAQADTLLQRATERAAELINDETLGEKAVQRVERGIQRVLGRATADVSSLPIREVRERLLNGESFAQIAESQGHTADEVLQEAEANVQRHLDRAVNDERISQEEADARLEEFRTLAADLINQAP